MKYIDAGTTAEKISNEFEIPMSELCDVFADIPATDVQPVKHGKWIDCTFYDPCEKSWERDFEFKCSNCGHKIYNKPNDDNLFCGHCGARMDLKGGDANE